MVCFYTLLIEFLNEYILYLIHVIYQLAFNSGIFDILLFFIEACNAGDLSSIPGWRRSPGGGHGNPLQYSCLENPQGQRSLAGCSPWVHKELDTTEWLSTARRMVDLQNCVSFRSIVRWFTYVYMNIYIYKCNFQAFSIIGYYKILNIIPCKSLFNICFI